MPQPEETYNADETVNADWWDGLDEDERAKAVMEFHRGEQVELPNEALHAMIHVAIENQILLGEETPVAATLDRLMGEGLCRHDALHALGSVFTQIMFDGIRDQVDGGDAVNPSEEYFQQLQDLTAAGWLAEYS